jgi:hypothetical protein
MPSTQDITNLNRRVAALEKAASGKPLDLTQLLLEHAFTLGEHAVSDDELIERAEIDLEVADIGELLTRYGIEPTAQLVTALWNWKAACLVTDRENT